MLLEDISQRYSRTMALSEIGEEGQDLLSQKCLLVVGAGGLGSAFLPLVVAAGVKRVIIYEDDVVTPSNLARQTMFRDSQLELSKAVCAGNFLQGLNQSVEVIARPKRFLEEDAREIETVDVVADCSDNFPTRFLLNDICATYSKPLLFGAVNEFWGQATLLHGDKRVSLRDIYDQPSTHVPVAKGIFSPLVHLVGTLMAAEALKLLSGMPTSLDGVLLQVDLKTMRFQRYEVI